MNTNNIFRRWCWVLVVLFSVILDNSVRAQAVMEPWKDSQLIEPAALAKVLADPAAKTPLVFCIGPGAVVKGSIDMGAARDSVNLGKFRQRLAGLPKNTPLVIYCGCCPFVHCPNIRPAFRLLNEMGFTQAMLLDVPRNIKVDWIDKGYPVLPH